MLNLEQELQNLSYKQYLKDKKILLRQKLKVFRHTEDFEYIALRDNGVCKFCCNPCHFNPNQIDDYYGVMYLVNPDFNKSVPYVDRFVLSCNACYQANKPPPIKKMEVKKESKSKIIGTKLTLIQKLIKKLGPTCYYCTIGTIYKEHPICPKINHNAATTDHKIPKSKNGTNSKKNLVVCCAACNFLKGDMTEQEYKQSGKLQDRINFLKNNNLM